MTKRAKTRAKPIVFGRLADGTLLRRRKDGSFHPVKDKSDRERLAAPTDAEIERMAPSAPITPGSRFFQNGVRRRMMRHSVIYDCSDGHRISRNHRP
jgi:hypothetical protein